MNYIQYFKVKQRVNGENYIYPVDSSPVELDTLIMQIHDSFGDCWPNDWIYKIILEALQALSVDKLDDISVEADCYTHELVGWLTEPFAATYCDDVLDEDAIYSRHIYDVIAAAQSQAKWEIYDKVSQFLDEQKQITN